MNGHVSLGRNRTMKSLLLIALMCAATAVAFAAADRGYVSGTIRGENGRAVPSVLVTVLGTGRSALTDVDGKFAVTDVPTGSFRLEIRPHNRAPVVLPLIVNPGENAIGLVTLPPDMPVITKDPGFPTWKRIGTNRAVAYRLGADCAASVPDTLPPTTVRADSVVAAGHVTLALVPEDPSRLSFAFTPKGPVGHLAMTVVDPKGRPIRRLRAGPAPQASALAWDGRDDFGREVPPGPYRARFVMSRGTIEFPFCRREITVADSTATR
jgi:hypothetical protein